MIETLPLTINDLFFLVGLTVSVILLVKKYLEAPLFSSVFRKFAVCAGLLAVLLGFFLNDFVFSVVGVTRADDVFHDYLARDLADVMSFFGVGYLLELEDLTLGNQAYRAWLAIFYFITGVTKPSGEALNGFLGFWGSLALCSYIARYVRAPQTPFVPPNYLLLILFMPSVLFWTTNLYKEGPMYWAVCMVATSWRQTGEGPNMNMNIGPGLLIGVVVGLIFRAYIMVLWITAVSIVTCLQSRRVLVRILIIPICLAAVATGLSQLGARLNFQDLKEYGDYQAGVTQKYTEEAGGRSNIKHDSGGRGTFFISGFVSLFFRPFPWDVTNFRFFLSSAEIWIMSSSIVIGWLRAGPKIRRALIRRPDIRAAIIACLLFSCVYTFIVNQGIIARSRVQSIPAITILAFSPFLLRKSLRQQNVLRLYSRIPEVSH